MFGKGILVAVEGIDGTGKSTTLKIVRERAERSECPFVFTKEPAGTGLGDRLHSDLLDARLHLDKVTQAYLFAAARADHVRKVVLPALEQGKVVICDRFLLSSLAYQGDYHDMSGSPFYTDYVDTNSVLQMNLGALSPLFDNATCFTSLLAYFTLPMRDIRLRMSGRKNGKFDRYDERVERSDHYLEHLRWQYELAYDQWNGKKFKVDARHTPRERAERIWKMIEKVEREDRKER